MSKRYHETPMDFEYQNGTGPMDAKSPFAAISLNAQRFPATPSAGSRKSVFPFTLKRKAEDDRNKENATTDTAPPKGDYNAFDSPSRAGASRNPSPNKALPPVPANGNGFSGVSAFNSMFATPRKTVQDTHMEDSSAGETPKSPERQDDSEAGTPAEKLAFERRRLGGGIDTRSAPAIPTVSTLSMSPSKEMGREKTRERERERERDRDRERRERRPSPGGKKESFFGRVKRSFNSPGRGEVPRADTGHNREHRIQRKKSQRQLVLQRTYDEPDSGSEGENDDSELTMPRTISPRKRSANYSKQPSVEPQTQQPPPQKEPGLISSLFTFIGAHPTVPHILTFYAQLAFNLFLLSACAYLLYSFWSAIQGDVDKKAFEASADIIAEIVEATEQFRINGCASSTRAPALKRPCENWERLMAREPMKIARAKVSAHAFAEIFNSFVEPISYKAMLFTAMIIFGCFAVSNFAFGVLRNKAMEQQHTQQHWGGPYNFQAPPPTPQRSFSGLIEGQGGAYQGTPWHGGPALEPAPSQRYDLNDGQGSPRRRLVYN